MPDSRDVCAGCFENADIKDRIIEYGGDPGCDFCDEADDAPTMPLSDLCEILVIGIETKFSHSVDILYYDDEAESGFAGSTWSTEEALFEDLDVKLDRDHTGILRDAILSEIGDGHEPWCEYDPAVLDTDESMLLDWERFSNIVKYERRFFFHERGENDEWVDDSLSPRQLLRAIARLIDTRHLIKMKQYDDLSRVRRHENKPPLTTAKDLGPPPPEKAVQSNRMNPPGVSMFYGAEDPNLAIAETRAEINEQVSLGTFRSCEALRLLDLVNIPEVRGHFSGATRDDILALRFLHAFAELIIAPVRRSNETELDYIPTQGFTEFLRDYRFSDGPIDGVRYGSSTGIRGANVVLFVGPDQVADVGETTQGCKLQFVSVREEVRDANAAGSLFDARRAVWGTPLFPLEVPPDLPGARLSKDVDALAMAQSLAGSDGATVGYAYDVDSLRLTDFLAQVHALGLREQDLLDD